MGDDTEEIRRDLIANQPPLTTRADFEAEYGRVWDTTQLQEDFEVIGFMAPFVVVKRKSDGVKGSLEFQHLPRYYYSFREN